MAEPRLVRLVVDPASSRIAIHTRAKGMLATFAHDLEIVASNLQGSATPEGDGFTGDLTVRVAGLRVNGTLHGERVDASALSPSDRSEIEKKIRDEVFSGTSDIRVAARGASRSRADVTVDAGSGKQSVSVGLSSSEDGSHVNVSGKLELSMKRLGLREVKGPLGAFKVSDGVEVLFDLTLRPEG